MTTIPLRILNTLALVGKEYFLWWASYTIEKQFVDYRIRRQMYMANSCATKHHTRPFCFAHHCLTRLGRDSSKGLGNGRDSIENLVILGKLRRLHSIEIAPHEPSVHW